MYTNIIKVYANNTICNRTGIEQGQVRIKIMDSVVMLYFLDITREIGYKVLKYWAIVFNALELKIQSLNNGNR